MALQIKGVIGPQSAEVSDNGYQYTLSDGNIAWDGETTFTGDGSELGHANAMFDNDATTYAAKLKTGGGTGYITIDFKRKYTDTVINVYFSSVVNTGGGNTITTTLQSSLDGSSWTDLSSVARSSVGETFKNYGGTVTLRYIRAQIAFAGTDQSQGRVYSLRVTKK